MDFQEYLETTAQQINQELERFFKAWSKEVQAINPKIVSLNKAFIEASKGGKRIRGSLVKLGYELTTSPTSDEILKPAIAFEIFQTAILAHDDIIDQSPLRRGKPTLYQVLGGNQYGISQTICLGDIGYFLAFRILSQSNFSAERKIQAWELFAQGTMETALGQMLDIELPYSQESKKETDALTVFRLKTARYTVVGPLSLGAILGGANKKLLGEIVQFGESLGVAFQIQDDILGVFGDEKTLGKSVTSDIEEGKNTLLIIQALKKGSPKQKNFLKKHYGQGKIGERELGEIKKIFINTGALDYSQGKAGQLIKKAKQIIKKMDIPQDKKQLLSGMADFLVQRER